MVKSLLDHVRDDTIGLPWSSVILRSTVPEDFQSWVSRYSVLVTQRLVLCAVDLLVSVSFRHEDSHGNHDKRADRKNGSRHMGGVKTNLGELDVTLGL